MSSEQGVTVVFKDQAGQLSLVPLTAVEQRRMPEAHKAELERLIEEEREEVRGYLAVIAIIGILIGPHLPAQPTASNWSTRVV